MEDLSAMFIKAKTLLQYFVKMSHVHVNTGFYPSLYMWQLFKMVSFDLFFHSTVACMLLATNLGNSRKKK